MGRKNYFIQLATVKWYDSSYEINEDDTPEDWWNWHVVTSKEYYKEFVEKEKNWTCKVDELNKFI